MTDADDMTLQHIIAYLAEYSALTRKQQAIYRAIAIRSHGIALWSGDIGGIAQECCCSRTSVYRAIARIRTSKHLATGVHIV